MKYLSFLFALISSLANAQFITNTGIQIKNSASLYTTGDWQNSGVFRNDGVITTFGAWQNTGTMDINSIGGFVLQYATPNSFSAGSNAASIGFIQKEGAGDVTISGSVLTKDSLKIISGLIKMNTPNDKLGITSNQFVFVSDGSYVEGPMECVGTGTFLLPLGLNGNYLPIKFHNSTSSRVGAVVEPAPGGATPGDAVESLFGFPYVWKTTEANVGDTARYVEVQAPDVLLGPGNIIITRQVTGNQYEAMGAKSSSSTGINTSYKSFDRGLKGTFSLGLGYAGTPEGDSTELVALFDNTNDNIIGTGWTNKTNWKVLNTEVVQWFGVKQKGGRVTEINLPSNRMQGEVPETLTSLLALKAIDISGNWQEGVSEGISSIPDLTGMPAIETVNVSGNNLDFEDLEANSSIIVADIGFYQNQAPLASDPYEEISAGESHDVVLPEPAGGTPANNSYQWKFKPYFPILGDTTVYANAPGVSTQEIYSISSVNRSTIGKYKVEVQNSAVPDLILSSEPFGIEAVADIAGVFKFGEDSVQRSDRPNEFKEMILLQITTGGYDTILFNSNGVRDKTGSGFKGVSVKNTPHDSIGTYEFKSVLLRDYLINGFADTLITQYTKAIPTWYAQTFLWEEADTLVLISDTTNINIVSVERPEHPVEGPDNFGTITGVFWDGPVSEGGKINAAARVSRSPGSVRREQESGRGAAEPLVLVDYIFTNVNGVFTFKFLEGREYKFNLQYPGYPMDEDPSSFIQIPIADDLFNRHIGVEAEVIEGKIFVRRMLVTGWEEPVHTLTAYPNPTAEFLFVKGKHDPLTQFKLFDSSGRSMNMSAVWNDMDSQWVIDVRELKPGSYILQLRKQAGNIEKLRVMVH